MPDKAEQFSSDEGAEEALNAAIAAEAATTAEEQAAMDARFSDAPAGETEARQQVQTKEEPAATTPEATKATAEAQQESPLFDGTVNPDELIAQHPELAPLVRQLTGAWTKKTQSLAEERKQLEALGDIESLQQARELAARISDPRNWPQLHSELAGLMQEYGMTPAEAHAEATRQVEGAQATEAEGLADFNTDDPELAPLVKTIQQLQSEIASFRNERDADAEAAREEAEAQRWHDALLGEITRQEQTIMQNNPHYTTEPGPNGEPSDMDAIFELSSFHNGDLFKAQERYEALKGSFISKFVHKKEASAASAAAHPSVVGAGTHTEPAKPQTMEELTDELEEQLRRMQDAGEFDPSS